jgi:hypothetical protein
VLRTFLERIISDIPNPAVGPKLVFPRLVAAIYSGTPTAAFDTKATRQLPLAAVLEQILQ